MMEHKNIFSFETHWKSLMMLLTLVILPNLLGMLNMPTVFGFKIHTFQIAVFLAAAIYGPVGGLISGGLGSMFSALAMGNPYIIIGNIILGFMAGYFVRKGFHLVIAAFFAYLIQMPWLYITDVYLMSMPVVIVVKIMIALLVTDILWAAVAQYGKKYLSF
jgi:uncharacterized membrane protein